MAQLTDGLTVPGDDTPRRRVYFESPKDMGMTVADANFDPETGAWVLKGIDIKVNISDPLTAYAISFADAVELGKTLGDNAKVAFLEQQLTYRTMSHDAIQAAIAYWDLDVPAASVLAPLVGSETSAEPQPEPAAPVPVITTPPTE